MDISDEQQFIESFGVYFEQLGVPPMMGRIMAQLLICDPPHQTINQLAAALQASKSSISTMSRWLLQAQLIERINLPGDRHIYFRISKGAWTRGLHQRLQEIARMRHFAAQGLAVLEGASPERRARLEEMHALYVFYEQAFPRLIAEWQALQDEPTNEV